MALKHHSEQQKVHQVILNMSGLRVSENGASKIKLIFPIKQ